MSAIASDLARIGRLFSDDAIEACAAYIEKLERARIPPKSFADLAADIRSLKSDPNHKALSASWSSPEGGNL